MITTQQSSVFRTHVGALAQTLATPFYIYDAATIRERVAALRTAMPENAEVFYAMKANPSLSIVRFLYALGCGIEIASGGELMAALHAGVLPTRIVFGGPGKTDGELEDAIRARILAVNVESIGELLRLDAICRRLGATQHVHIRVNTNFEVKDQRITMSGGARQFGIDEEQLPDVAEVIPTLTHVRVVGLQVFAASQVEDAEVMKAYIASVCESVRHFVHTTGVDVTSVDIGSGIGISYDDINSKPVLHEEFHAIFAPLAGLQPMRCIIESGRYLVGDAGIYATRIVDRKHSRGTEYYICDGGINHLMRPALIGAAHPVTISGRDNASCCENVVITGPLCTPLDVLCPNSTLPDAEVGDTVYVHKCGAYGYTESMPYFLSHSAPNEYMLTESGTVELLRAGRTPRDVIAEQVLRDATTGEIV